MIPCVVTCNFTKGDYHEYNISTLNNFSYELVDASPVIPNNVMKNSFDYTPQRLFYRKMQPQSQKFFPKLSCAFKEQESIISDLKLNTSRHHSDYLPKMDASYDESYSHRVVLMNSKLKILKKVLQGISDNDQIIINSRPKNKSQKIRKSNRNSRYRGVSLNGKKWQVMIMGPARKKYFGGIATEREAAYFYDKLSIVSNGLAAKTNFNYRKLDLCKIMRELE